ncbi:MAG: AAA family ATPase, partial [Pseudomonadota bacterium]
MRYIDRNAMTPPSFLHSKEMEIARAEMDDFLKTSLSGAKTRRAPRDGYLKTDTDARNQMADAFGHVCAYCESTARADKTGPALRGVIAQHRPASNALNRDGSTHFLAYTWLTYEWENLLWICANCARRKENRFFVAKRAPLDASVQECREVERALMVDPCEEHPWAHLLFAMDGRIHPSDDAGAETINWLGLNHSQLIARRRKRIETTLEALKFFGSPITSTSVSLQVEGDLLVGTKLNVDDPRTHLGAATMAILNHAQSQGFAAGSAADFLSEYQALAPSAQAAFRENAEEAVRTGVSRGETKVGSARSPKTGPRFAAPPKTSRTPDIKKMPLASTWLERVQISNFKALKGIDFELPSAVEDIDQAPCMLLLGENATGKSSVLEAMTLGLIGTREAAELDQMLPEEELKPSDLIHWSNPADKESTEEFMRVALGFLDSETPVEIHAHRDADHFEGTEEPSKIILAYGPRRFFTKRTRRFRAPAHRVRSMFDPMAMIANPIDWLTSLDQAEFEAAARALREVLMLSNDDDFVRDEDEGEGRIYITANGARTALKDMSVGYKSVIAMVCDIIRELLYQYDNLEFAHGVVFIDEIETHLHPRWKMQIMHLLRLAFPQVQFIVTTHDPLFSDRGAEDHVVLQLVMEAVA